MVWWKRVCGAIFYDEHGWDADIGPGGSGGGGRSSVAGRAIVATEDASEDGFELVGGIGDHYSGGACVCGLCDLDEMKAWDVLTCKRGRVLRRNKVKATFEIMLVFSLITAKF